MMKLLKEQRTKLNTLDSFEEIVATWQSIKHLYEKCSATLTQVSAQISNLEDSQKTDDINPNDMQFGAAMKELQEISEKVKGANVADLPILINRMKTLKNFCFQQLETEKMKIEEVAQ